MKSNILIVEDHELTRFGLKTTFDGVDFIGSIFEAGSAEDAFDILKNETVHLVIMDVGLPGMNGIDASKKIKSEYDDIKIIMLTSHNDENAVLNSLKAGANAYCSKEINLQRLVQVVNSVLDGASWFDPSISQVVLKAATSGNNNEPVKKSNDYNLTSREHQILKLITEGYSNTEIAKELNVSVNTTKAHVASILQKLVVDDRLQAALKALKEKVV
ncbi:response regulator transcription factor [bacterium]|nr:response regulator transcription factor [bacterium]